MRDERRNREKGYFWKLIVHDDDKARIVLPFLPPVFYDVSSPHGHDENA